MSQSASDLTPVASYIERDLLAELDAKRERTGTKRSAAIRLAIKAWVDDGSTAPVPTEKAAA